jgi:carbamate kinase
VSGASLPEKVEIMRIVVALGGNALLERGERPDSDIQQSHVQRAVAALAPLARVHDLVITHGNGPQVGMLALESARDPELSHPFPLDVLGAQTQGMIGYWLAQALGGAVPGRAVGCLICQTRVDRDDPAFENPAKFVGPVYQEEQARAGSRTGLGSAPRRRGLAPGGALARAP